MPGRDADHGAQRLSGHNSLSPGVAICKVGTVGELLRDTNIHESSPEEAAVSCRCAVDTGRDYS